MRKKLRLILINLCLFLIPNKSAIAISNTYEGNLPPLHFRSADLQDLPLSPKVYEQLITESIIAQNEKVNIRTEENRIQAATDLISMIFEQSPEHRELYLRGLRDLYSSEILISALTATLQDKAPKQRALAAFT